MTEYTSGDDGSRSAATATGATLPLEITHEAAPQASSTRRCSVVPDSNKMGPTRSRPTAYGYMSGTANWPMTSTISEASLSSASRPPYSRGQLGALSPSAAAAASHARPDSMSSLPAPRIDPIPGS